MNPYKYYNVKKKSKETYPKLFKNIVISNLAQYTACTSFITAILF